MDREELWWSAHSEQSSSETKSRQQWWIRSSVWNASSREGEMEGEGTTKGLGPKKKGGRGTHGTSHDGGVVAAGQSSGRDRATWSAREKARGEGLGRRTA
jgi:hypothetical protein